MGSFRDEPGSRSPTLAAVILSISRKAISASIRPGGHGAPSGQHDLVLHRRRRGTVADLRPRGWGSMRRPITDHGYGLVTHLTMPGGVRVQLYQPNIRSLTKKVAPPSKRAKAPRARPSKPRRTQVTRRFTTRPTESVDEVEIERKWNAV